MGWWNATREGQSLVPDETGLVWGDEPADVMDDALDRIAGLFEEVLGREPTLGELRSGLEFSLNRANDDVNFSGRFLI